MNKNIFKNRIFGRTKSRNISKIKIENYYNLLEMYKFFKINKFKDYILDIGSGNGETTLYLSQKYPEKIVIACDKYINGNYNLLKTIQDKKIKNIFIYDGNVHDIFDTYGGKIYFELVWIFFPDPWPKKKHNKRRLLTSSFLRKIYNHTNNKSSICLITDSTSYINDILKNIYNCKHMYKWTNQNKAHLDLKDYYDLETKFYKKAIISGRNPLLFTLEKIYT